MGVETPLSPKEIFMRLNIDFWVKCAKFQKDVKKRSKEESWKEIIEPRLQPPTVKEIQRGESSASPARDREFAKIAWDEVYDGIPRPFASPDDVVDTEKDAEIKRLEAEKKAFEKDDEIARLKEEVANLRKRKTSGEEKGSKRKVSAEG